MSRSYAESLARAIRDTIDACTESSAPARTNWHIGTCADSPVPERVNRHIGECVDPDFPGKVNGHTAARVSSNAPGNAIAHMAECAHPADSARRHAIHFTAGDVEYALLRRVQEFRGARGPNDLATIFFTGLELLKQRLERQKLAQSGRPPRARRLGSRRIPAAVRRAVWKRDGGQCAFIGRTGHRCEARRGLDCDHIVPVARGGESTLSNVWLLCRTHSEFVVRQLSRDP